MAELFAILLGCSMATYYLYTGTAVFLSTVTRLGARRPAAANLIWYWCKYPALTYLVLGPVSMHIFADFGIIDTVSWAACDFLWWVCRDAGDDEDHKKLKKKLKDKVTELHGRLVIVPETA